MAENLDKLREELGGAPWLITDFRLDTSQSRPLGDGTYGEVFAVKWKGSWVAAKRLFSRFFEKWNTGQLSTKKTKQMFEQECSLLTRLHHPNIVQLFGVYLPDDYPNSSPVLVMELLDKTLSKRICTAPRLTLSEIITHSLEIASALRFSSRARGAHHPPRSQQQQHHADIFGPVQSRRPWRCQNLQ